jgi:hypothetical protein
MGINHPIRFIFLIHVGQHLLKNAMLQNISVIASMESVAVCKHY